MAGKGLIDNVLALDYLPYLRAMAFHENKVHLASQNLLRDSETTRKSKRRKPSSCREHYLNEFCGKYNDFQHDLIDLGDSYLMKNC